jgi:putative ABC transport system ATP-binding protein
MPETSHTLDARALTVSRRVDAGLIRVLDGVDLALEAGTLTDIVGPSGSGKSTLLLALARLLPGVEGRLALEGQPADEIDPRVWRMRVAYLPQRNALQPGTVASNLTLPWRLKIRAGIEPPDETALRAALDRVHLADVALDRDVARLSEGQAARITFVRTLLTGPHVLLLDEPDAALDAESSAEVGSATREFADAGGSVVRVRHHVADGLADRRLRLEHGHLAEVAS